MSDLPIGFESAKEAAANTDYGKNMVISARLVLELTNLIEQQQKSIVELKATLDRLHGVERDETCYGQIIMEILDITPHQNLNAIKREVARSSHLAGSQWEAYEGVFPDRYERMKTAKEYAAQRYPDKE